MKKLLLLAVLAIVGFTTVGCATRIGPGHVGIKVDMAGSNRGVQDYTTSTGWMAYTPGFSTVVEYPTYVQTVVWTKNTNEGNPVDESITFTTKDAMTVNMDVNLSYQLKQEKIPAFYVRFRSDDLTTFTNGYLHNIARDCFNEVAGKYGVEQIMGDNAPFLKDARECLSSRVSDIGVDVQSFGIIGAPRPPQQVIDSINLKVQASQIALQKENEVRQAQAEAQKQIAIAEGNSKAHIAQANGDAQYVLTLAEAQAKANRIVSESLTPQLLQQKAIDRWNGSQPQVLGGGGERLLFNIPVQSK
jgi:regulator of protease activity HflC (stomatin/prohibitin superfamily)